MDANAKALAAEYGDGYRQGFKDGYNKGIADGQVQGYAEAKVRAHVAVKDLTNATKRLNANVGKAEED
jgi:flagellar biosynthesis/type III secretory pathway protein FliH